MKNATGESAPTHVLDLLQANMDVLPNALSRIAKYVLEHPEMVIHQSVTELGSFSGSGEASIVRLCRSLGFRGYRDFKMALAMELSRPAGLHSAATEASPYAPVRQGFEQSLAEASGTLDAPGLAQAAAILLRSRRIDIYGAGLSSLSADMLTYRLLRLGLPAFSFRDAHIAHEVAHGLDADCAAVAFSLSGLTDDTVRFLRSARHARARAIAVTGRAASPVAEAADLVIRLAGLRSRNASGPLAPLTANIFLIECLGAELARQRMAPL
ncbi:MurR/RpiR family transcriptional regulator [Szabonella alba]|uniref:MurR/RpiR family transcriptional regulator n=1 Tax=Szabonella alba TaxID=2804194 RepID=A0A8K0V786_9RHOB|nr:MurR/RpiR family transcriptional regulator [Szabonella alba]MBL4916747.1 MurR/RpiR family transcriptional regulator [Szabonella alba]